MSKRLTIGVDFGTTYSGVAYSHPVDNAKEPFVIKDWGAGPTSEKVPTVIRYNVSDKLAGMAGYKWGYEVKHHERRQEWFKLALDPMRYKAEDCVDLSQSYTNELAEPPDYSRDVTTLVTDYLTALRKQVMKTLESQYGREVVKAMRIDWVITSPAVWSARAKDDTLRCAEKAGMGGASKVTITSEPEAAAAYALQTIEPLTVKPGNSIVICDAGGGTVDLITYKINSLRPLEVEECAIPSGGKCGGVFVNRIFEKMVENRLGRNSGLTDLGKHQLLAHFDTYAKRDFADSGDPNEEWYLPAAGAKNNSAARVSGGNLQMTADDMRKCFDPVVQEVVSLVQRQIANASGEKGKTTVSAVLLVGGFGESRYLRKRLEKAIAPISLLCPPNGWSAIARGAVIKAMAAKQSLPAWTVSSRKAVAHYGIETMVPFVAGTHPESKKFWDSCDGGYKCHEVMNWFIHRGEDLGDNVARSFSFYRNIAVGTKLKITEEILSCMMDQSPDYFETDKCKNHVQLKVDLSSVPKHKFTKKGGVDGKEYYRIDFQILATYHSAHVEYKWQFLGDIYGDVKARYSD